MVQIQQEQEAEYSLETKARVREETQIWPGKFYNAYLDLYCTNRFVTWLVTIYACYCKKIQWCMDNYDNTLSLTSNKYSHLHLRDHVLERFHDTGALAFLVIWEDACDDHDSCEHNAQVQLQTSLFVSTFLFVSIY